MKTGGRQSYRNSQNMLDAIEESMTSEKSVVSPAREHKVGYDALRRRINGDLEADAITGRAQGLRPGEEKALVLFALLMAGRGLGLTRPMLKARVMTLVSNRRHAFGESTDQARSGSATF